MNRPPAVAAAALGGVVIGGLGWLLTMRWIALGIALTDAEVLRQGYGVLSGGILLVTVLAGMLIVAGLKTLRRRRSARNALMGVLGGITVIGLLFAVVMPAFLAGVASATCLAALLLPESRAWFERQNFSDKE